MKRRGWLTTLVACAVVVGLVTGCNTTEIQSRDGATITTRTVIAVDLSNDSIGLMAALRDELVFHGYEMVSIERLKEMESDGQTSGLSDDLVIVAAAIVRLHRLDVSSRKNVEYVDIRFFSWPDDQLLTSVRWKVVLGSYRSMPYVAELLAEKTDDHFRKRNQDR